MPSCKSEAKQYISAGERLCKELGYTQCGSNWYRCYGEGLLQVVTFHGISEHTDSNDFKREPTVALGIYSLYDNILWITFPILGARRDLIPRFLPSIIFSGTDPNQFLGTAAEARMMLDSGLPFLQQVTTHMQLATFLESLDLKDYGSVRVNDGNKIVPYLLSGQPQKALDSLTAIELQRMAANYKECKSQLDNQRSGKRADLLRLKDELAAGNSNGVVEILQTYYQTNTDYLTSMGIPIPQSGFTSAQLQQVIGL